MSTEVDKTPIEMFECPVCAAYMVPPIFQCIHGHHVCDDCNSKIDKCPLCRGPKEGRAMVVEGLASKMEFPCRYAPNGCEARAKSDGLRMHELGCKYAYRMCPFTKLQRCHWSGCQKDIVDHFSVKHPQSICFERTRKVPIFRMRNQFSNQSISLLKSHGVIFMCYCSYDRTRDIFKISVTHYGTPDDERRFCYKVSILNCITNKEVVKISAPCYATRDEAPLTMGILFDAVQGCLHPDVILVLRILNIEDSISV